MKKLFVSLVLLVVSSAFVFGQKLPVRNVTVFKNGRSLVFKSGKVPASGGKYVVRELPDALFGTFWISGAEVSGVFTVRDSVEKAQDSFSKFDFLKKNVGKQVKLNVLMYDNNPFWLEGTLEKVWDSTAMLRTAAGRWVSVGLDRITEIDFPEKPDFNFSKKVVERRLEVSFKSANRAEQEISMAYLTGNLGWTPIYKLDLFSKEKGRLALRAEVLNDAENLGDTELRLAVGVPNFMYANGRSNLVDFENGFQTFQRDNYRRPELQNQVYYNVAFDAETYEERVVPAEGPAFEGSQAEDFYFYSVKPGNFPKNSRFQHPVFEADVAPEHFYECNLPEGSPGSFNQYKSAGQKPDDKYPVFHFIEFPNPTKFPWTTGAVNISSSISGELQPLSQDMLPYTPAGAKCKVKIAQSPEIKVTHAEGDVDRKENAKRFFSHTYDQVKIEGQICAVNYKNEPVTLKIRRNVEGTPGQSEQKWVLSQEQATLRVNPSFVVEWTVELKPGEEKKWKYDYEVYVNF